MGVNHVTTADGEELINLMSDTVDEYSLLEGATAHDASGEQIRGKAVYVNPNILDNGDLAVNQRGKTEYVGSGYTADRWQIDGAGGKVVLGKNTVTISSDGAAMAYVNQPLPMGDELAGQTLTASLVLADGTKLTGSGVCPVSPSSGFSLFITIPINDKIGVRVYKDVDTIIWQFRMSAECSVEFQRKFKLELGKVATPFVTPNTAVELLKCQRMFYRLTPDGSFPMEFIASVSPVDKSYCNAVINVPASMRIKPTVVANGDFYLMDNTGVEHKVTSLAVAYNDLTHQALLLTIHVANVYLQQDAVIFRIPAGRYIDFSAEL